MPARPPRRAALVRRAERRTLTIEEARQLVQALEEEEAFLQRVRDWALLNQWLVYHTRRSDDSDAGFFDLYALHVAMGRILHAELKTAEGDLSLKQQVWGEALCLILDAWGAAGLNPQRVEYHLWQPSDWPEIEAAFRWLR